MLWRFPDGTATIEDFTFPPYNSTTIHTVKVNESLLDIAYTYYGDHREWHLIAKMNHIINPFQDMVGSKLIIPIYE